MRDEGLKSSGEIDVAKLGGGGPSDQSKPDNRPNKPRGSPIILPDNGQLFLSWGPVWMWTVHLIRSLIVFVLLYFGAAYFHSTTLGVLSLPLSVMAWEWWGAVASWCIRARFGLHGADFNVADNLKAAFISVMAKARKVFPETIDDENMPRIAVYYGDRPPFLIRSPIGGYIVAVPSDLIDKMHEKAFKFILAHEISHYGLRSYWHHTLRKRAFLLSTLMILALPFLPAGSVILVWSTLLISWAILRISAATISRYAEKDADGGALTICMLLNIDPYYAAKEAFETLASMRGKDFLEYQSWILRKTVFFDSHPSAKDRLGWMRQEKSRRGWPKVVSPFDIDWLKIFTQKEIILTKVPDQDVLADLATKKTPGPGSKIGRDVPLLVNLGKQDCEAPHTKEPTPRARIERNGPCPPAVAARNTNFVTARPDNI